MKVNQSAVLLSALPIILLGFALLIAFISDFSSVIGLILSVDGDYLFLRKNNLRIIKEEMALFVFCIFMTLICIIAAKLYHGIMTWDYGPFYFPASE